MLRQTDPSCVARELPSPRRQVTRSDRTAIRCAGRYRRGLAGLEMLELAIVPANLIQSARKHRRATVTEPSRSMVITAHWRIGRCLKGPHWCSPWLTACGSARLTTAVQRLTRCTGRCVPVGTPANYTRTLSYTEHLLVSCYARLSCCPLCALMSTTPHEFCAVLWSATSGGLGSERCIAASAHRCIGHE